MRRKDSDGRESIKTALLRWFLLLGLLPMLLASTWSYFNTRAGLQEVIQSGLLKQIESQATFIDNWFYYRTVETELLADSPVTVQLLKSLSSLLKSSGLPLSEVVKTYDWRKTLLTHRNYYDKQWIEFDYVYDMFIIDQEGHVLFSVAGEMAPGANLSHQEYQQTKLALVYQNALASGKTLFSELELHQLPGRHIYGYVATPIIDESGRIVGVFAIKIKLHRIEGLLKETSGHEGENYIVNNQNQFQIHSMDTFLFDDNRFSLPSDSELLTEVDGIKVYDTVSGTGEPVISVHRKIRVNNLDWVLINEKNTQIAFASLTNIVKAQLLFIVMTSIAIFFFARRQVKKISQPIVQMTESFNKPIEELQETDFDVEARYELVELVAALRDIWGKSRAYRADLQRNIQLLDAIVNNLGAALIMIDAKGSIQRFTPTAEEIFGYSEQEMLRQNVKVLMPDKIAAKHDDILSNYRPGKESIVIGQSLTLQGKRKNGELFDLDIIVTAVELEDSRMFIGLITDVTERVKSQKALEEALTKADAANKAKSEFLANMSHEIRTPMNAIYGTLQLLDKSRMLPEKLVKLVEKARYSSQSLLTIINDILDFSKIEAGMLELEQSAFDVSKVVQMVISDLTPVAQEKGLTLKVEVAKECPQYWLGDQVRVKQILLNLTTNAVKFTKQGGVSVIISDSLKPAPGLYLLIEDTGIGMDPQTIDKLFERFEQADNSTTRKYGGTGLGMSITQSLVSMMEGTIEVASEPGKGSCFTVFLPLEQSHEAEPDKDKPSAAKAPDMSGIKILLAEDNDINQMVFESMMQATKAELIMADNGEIAVSACQESLPDLIFMDIQMPVMDGVDACLKIKEIAPKLPIIALTANILDEDIRKYKEAGFDDIIGKPIEISELYRFLEDWMNHRH